jgi:antitoxin ParD1/3/4
MPAKFVRSVSLTQELTALIDEKIATGHYRSASEVVRAALRLLAEQDRGHGRRRQASSESARDVR